MKLFYEGILLGGKEIQHESLHTSALRRNKMRVFPVPGSPGWLSGISKNWTELEEV